jgi:hypothetical protein
MRLRSRWCIINEPDFLFATERHHARLRIHAPAVLLFNASRGLSPYR